MTKAYGQIESLKRIRETLDQKGISRFKTIGELNSFIKNYENEKESLFFKTERGFDLELDSLQAISFDLENNYTSLKHNTERKFNNRIVLLKKKCDKLRSHYAKNAIIELRNWYVLQILLFTKFILVKSYKYIVCLKTFRTKKRLMEARKKLNDHSINRHSIISTRFAKSIKDLEFTHQVVLGLNPLIAGAIGEHLVSKELEKLSDSSMLFNDYSLVFDRPIYNRKENDRIFSIQIDHLLITKAGVFVIETKNWSKESLQRYDLRSPVKQIQRASFALFVILNRSKPNGSRIIKGHHWGSKELPVRNIVAMINHKPKEKFKFVAIKKLNELKDYINYFDPIFDDQEVQSIGAHLRSIMK